MINIENFHYKIFSTYALENTVVVTDVTNLGEKQAKDNSTRLFPRYIGGRDRSFSYVWEFAEKENERSAVIFMRKTVQRC